MPIRYLDFLIHSSFQGVNRLFVLSFENKKDRESFKKLSSNRGNISKNIIKLHSMEEIFFTQIVKNNLRTYNNIREITTGQGDDYTNWCLLDSTLFLFRKIL